jgi:nucleoside-diphosphate-sugar epimerase
LNILLTGASGFLGKIIYSKISALATIKTLGRCNADYSIDLGNCNNNIIQEKFDLVIHAAGKAHVFSNFVVNESLIYRVNVLGTKYLLDSLIHIPKHFVFISSVSVYGSICGNLIDENERLNASDAYGKSKIEAEEIVKNWCDKNNVICTILRLPLLVGVNPPGNLGSLIKGIYSGYYFNIAGGKAKKSMVLASDVGAVVLKAAMIGGTYNLTDGYNPSFNELSNLIAKQYGKKYVPNIPFFVAKLIALIGDLFSSSFPINSYKLLKITSTLTFNDSKARKAFGWNPTPVLKGFNIHE